MNIDLFDVDKLIKVNSLQEVTSPVLLDKYNNVTSDGLLSYEIFGRTTDDRKLTWGYISLNGHFLNPLVYRTWLRIDRKIDGVVNGTTYVKVDSHGELIKVEDESSGWTGLEELYNHFDEIKFKSKSSVTQSMRTELIECLNKNEAFMTKLLIMPPFYRDVRLTGDDNVVRIHEYTEMYAKILRLSQSLKLNSSSGLEIISNVTRYKIQTMIASFYNDNLASKIFGKDGHFRKFVMGKSVDNCARLVITAPVFNKNTPDEMIESFTHVGLPLPAACACFYPFILKWLKDYFRNEFESRKNNYPKYENGKIKYYEVNTDEFNDNYFNKLINSFIHSPGDRFNHIEITLYDKDTHSEVKSKIAVIGDMVDKNTKAVKGKIQRPMTITDLMYRAAVNACADKHVNITRYPIEDYFGTFFAKINIVSTLETCPVIISDTFYPHYPVIDLDNIKNKDDVGNRFRDSLTMSNLYLEGLGGDYDGDQVTVKGIWSIEANKEADAIMNSTKNLLNICGNLNRTTTRDAIQAIYMISRN